MNIKFISLAGVVAIALSATIGFSAKAAGCPFSSCLFDPTNYYYGEYEFDYTINPDNLLRKWTISYTSDDPSARISIDGPTQVETIYTIRDYDGQFVTSVGTPRYRFDERFSPGMTTIYTRAPVGRPYTCGPSTALGALCFAEVHVWGNGTQIVPTGNSLITASFSESVVPEPELWLMLVSGFAFSGYALRCRRSLRGLSPAQP